MDRKTRTLIILTPGFPASEADSTCLPMQQCFVKALKANYPKLHIMVLSFQYPYVVQTYTWFGITVISFNGCNKGGLARLLLRRKLLAVLKEIHRNYDIAGVLSFWYNECAWVGKNFADKNYLKHYCWILGQDARKGNRYTSRVGLAGFELIALSDFLQDEFERNYFIKPAFVIEPGVDSLHFSKKAKQRDIDLLAAGSLIPLKRIEIFIEMVAAIRKQIPGINAVIIGQGPQENILKSVIEKNNLQNNIIMTGELPYAEVLSSMQRTKIFLHPSLYEGFSGVCQEALAAGAHVVSFCKAMKQDIDQWHIVSNIDEMKNLSLEILNSPGTSFDAIVPYDMNDTAKKMMKLFEL